MTRFTTFYNTQIGFVNCFKEIKSIYTSSK